jgi:hypothetical protein
VHLRSVSGAAPVSAIQLHPKHAPTGWRRKPIRPQTIFYHWQFRPLLSHCLDDLRRRGC